VKNGVCENNISFCFPLSFVRLDRFLSKKLQVALSVCSANILKFEISYLLILSVFPIPKLSDIVIFLQRISSPSFQFYLLHIYFFTFLTVTSLYLKRLLVENRPSIWELLPSTQIVLTSYAKSSCMPFIIADRTALPQVDLAHWDIRSYGI